VSWQRGPGESGKNALRGKKSLKRSYSRETEIEGTAQPIQTRTKSVWIAEVVKAPHQQEMRRILSRLSSMGIYDRSLFVKMAREKKLLYFYSGEPPASK